MAIVVTKQKKKSPNCLGLEEKTGAHMGITKGHVIGQTFVCRDTSYQKEERKEKDGRQRGAQWQERQWLSPKLKVERKNVKTKGKE